MYKLLGTHNSATGEKPINFVSLVGAPIGQCQSKTIAKQLEAGVRLFDLRVKPYRYSTNYSMYYPLEKIEDCTMGHGVCDYNITLKECVEKIDTYCKNNNGIAYVLVTLEGELTESKDKFMEDVKKFFNNHNYIVLLEINVKKPEWAQLWRNNKSDVTYTKDYPLIKGWKAILPFPRLWSLFIEHRPSVKNNVYSLRDFV